MRVPGRLEITESGFRSSISSAFEWCFPNSIRPGMLKMVGRRYGVRSKVSFSFCRR